jgi:hypothetical protein
MIALLYAGLGLLLGGALLWGGLRDRMTMAAALFCVLLVAIPLGFLESAGVPKPYRLEWRGLDDANVLGVSLDEPKAIYIWAMVPGEKQPRAYALPWDIKNAEQAQNALRQAEKNGGKAMMRPPSGAATDDEAPMFYAQPQQPPPPKAPPPARSAVGGSRQSL